MKEYNDAGKLLLRITLGGLMLFHGIAKLNGGVDGIAGMLAGQGLPGALAYLVYLGELVAPLLVVIGLWTRPAALIVAGNMVVALVLVHSTHFLNISNSGGWQLELQFFFLLNAITIALIGAGRYSLDARVGR